MKKKYQKYYIIGGIILLVVVLALIFYISQTSFVIPDNTFIQYTNYQSDHQGGCGAGYDDLVLSSASRTNNVSINTGISTFKFNLNENLIPTTSCSLKLCQGDLKVYKDNILIGNVTGISNSQCNAHFNTDIPYYFCDSLNNCIEVILMNGYTDVGTCLNSWKISYKIIPGNESIKVNIIPSKNEFNINESATMSITIKNNLNIPFKGTLTIFYKSNVLLGNTETNSSDINLLALENKTINLILPSLPDNYKYDIYAVLNVSQYGNNMNGLNFRTKVESGSYSDCGSTSTTSVTKPLTISTDELIPYNSITSNSYTVSFKGNTITINDTINDTTNSTNNTTQNNTNQNNNSNQNVTNNTSTIECWKVRQFLTQSSLGIDDSPCYNYILSLNVTGVTCKYMTQAECEASYNNDPWYLQFWKKYDFVIGIIAGILTIITSILWLLGYIKIGKKKK